MAPTMVPRGLVWRCLKKADSSRSKSYPKDNFYFISYYYWPDCTMLDLSNISPVYGCAGCLESLHHRISQTARSLGLSYEIVLVDDRGPDDSWLVMSALARTDPAHVRAIRLSRNFGQQHAISAGLAECQGRAAVVLDCDLQEPPEVITRLYEKFQEGHQVVLARRLAKQHHPLKRVTSWAYSRIMRMLSGQAISSDLGTLSLLGRPVVNQFKTFKDVNRHYLLIVMWLGFDPVTIDYEHQARAVGQSSYNLSRLIRLGMQGLFFQTTRWLEAVVLMGVLISVFGLGVGCWAFWAALNGNPSPGWASTVVLTCLLGGAIIFIQGVVGLYVGQIFDQVKGRPLYVVAERVGGLEATPSVEMTQNKLEL